MITGWLRKPKPKVKSPDDIIGDTLAEAQIVAAQVGIVLLYPRCFAVYRATAIVQGPLVTIEEETPQAFLDKIRELGGVT